MKITDKAHLIFKKTAKEQGWWDSKGIVVAVSGGSDSMALLTLLRNYYPGKIVVAHMEHGIREKSSREDADFVSRFCRSHNIPIYIQHGNIPQNKHPGESIEMAARRIRYTFFETIRIQQQCCWIATGHTSDDAVETILFNLCRGTGIRGLIGIRETREYIIRPVIHFSHGELQTILKQGNIPWCEDESNKDVIYTRNRIRHELLPWIKENINKGVNRHILALSEIASSYETTEEKRTHELIKWIYVTGTTAAHCWDIKTVRKLSRFRIASLLRHQGRSLQLPMLAFNRMSALNSLINEKSNWRFQWEGHTEVCACKDYLAWISRDDFTSPPQEKVPLVLGERLKIKWGKWNIEIFSNPQESPFRHGDYGATIPWDGKTSLFISSLSDYTQCINLKNSFAVPWWAQPQWPVFFTQNGEYLWSPKQYTGYSHPHKYAIIIRIDLYKQQ